MIFFKKKDNPKFRDHYRENMTYALYMVDRCGSGRGSLPVLIVEAKSPAEAWHKGQKKFGHGDFRSSGRLLKEECTLYDLYGPPKKVDIPHKICSECGDDLGIKC